MAQAEPNQPAGERADRSILWRGFLGATALLLLLSLLTVAAVLFASRGLEISSFRPGVSADLSGPYVPNDALTRGRLVATRWVEPGLFDRIRYQGVGPETVAVGRDGRLYTGLCDAGVGGTLTRPVPCRVGDDNQGWIVSINPKDPHDVVPYVRTGGRPLGLAFDAQGRLHIADAIKGLLRVTESVAHAPVPPPASGIGAARTVERLATCNRDDAQPDPQPTYTDSVAVAEDGTVWFTCPSQRWSLADIRHDVLESSKTGRVIGLTSCQGAPSACVKHVLVDDLRYANGIAVRDAHSVLVNEFTGFRILHLTFDDELRLVSRTPFLDNTPGYPDNLTIGADGTVWVGFTIKRQKLLDRFRPYPALLHLIGGLPESAVPPPPRYAWLLGLDPQGKVKWSLQDATGMFSQATGGYPVGDALYVGSYTESSLLCITRPGSQPTVDPCDPWAQAAPSPLAAVQP